MAALPSTDTGIRGLAPREDGERVEYWDSKVHGLTLLVGKRTKTWYAIYTAPDGKRKRLSIGRYPAVGLASAREKMKTLSADVHAKKIDPSAERKAHRSAPTFAELAEECLADKAAHGRLTRKTRQSYDSLLKGEIVPRIGARKINDLSRADFAGVVGPIRARGRLYLANRALELMRSICRWAVDHGLIAIDPTAGLKPGKEHSRDRTLSDAELAALWKALDGISDQARDCYKLLLLTGQREMEVLGMQWSEIDFGKALWTLPAKAEGRSKKRERAHVVPLSPPALDILRLAREAWPEGGAVFQTVKRNGERTTARRGLISGWKPELDASLQFAEPWRIHDLRRTMRSGLSLLAVPPHIAELVIGHAAGGIIRVYDQYDYVAEKRDALNRWAGHLLRVVGEDEAPERGGVVVAMPGAGR